MKKIITSRIIKSLNFPKPASRKRDNGRLLVIAGADPRYFGALLYCLTTASRLVDLVYLMASPLNHRLPDKLRLATGEFMPITGFPNIKLLSDIDCILIGPGMGKSPATKKLVKQTLQSGKKSVLDADALNVLDEKLKKLLSPLHILTPHHKEFYRLFKLAPSQKNASAMAKRYGCTILLKGKVDIITTSNNKICQNFTGNAGMTKGGTGDVLAGLVAALFCNNGALTAAAAGAYINGQAGDDLYKKYKTFYNAEDLSKQIPVTLACSAKQTYKIIKGTLGKKRPLLYRHTH